MSARITSAVCRSGSTTLTSAPASSERPWRTSTQPSRAANSSGVSPPGGSHLSRGSERALALPGDDAPSARSRRRRPRSASSPSRRGPAPPPTSAASGRASSRSRPATRRAPTSTFAAATWPARAQVCSAVSPCGPVAFGADAGLDQALDDRGVAVVRTRGASASRRSGWRPWRSRRRESADPRASRRRCARPSAAPSCRPPRRR